MQGFPQDPQAFPYQIKRHQPAATIGSTNSHHRLTCYTKKQAMYAMPPHRRWPFRETTHAAHVAGGNSKGEIHARARTQKQLPANTEALTPRLGGDERIIQYYCTIINKLKKHPNAEYSTTVVPP